MEAIDTALQTRHASLPSDDRERSVDRERNAASRARGEGVSTRRLYTTDSLTELTQEGAMKRIRNVGSRR